MARGAKGLSLMNSSDEVKELQKRLEAVERAVKQTAGALCTTTYNLFVNILRGEEQKRYADYWKPKLDSARKAISDAPTLDKSMDLAGELLIEIGEYATGRKVDTADRAMEIAHSFIKKYSAVALPLKAVREDDSWLVDIDVGALAVKVAKVKIDARTGDVLSYEIPPTK